MPQENENTNEVTLSLHHYPDHLIETGLATTDERPLLVSKTEDGDTRVVFSGVADKAKEFANHLIAARRQMKGI